jgi:hypothetical protein
MVGLMTSSPQTPREIADEIIGRNYGFTGSMRDAIESALTRARLEGAEEMNEAAAALLDARGSYGDEVMASDIRALPLTPDPKKSAVDERSKG